MVPYGADPVISAPETQIRDMGLESDSYLLSVCRIEPDNNVQLLVEAFSRRRRGMKLVVVGAVDEETRYGRAVRKAASDEVIFPGAIYDAAHVQALRFHARAYLHGHTVGGTNPSLVEALWAGNAVIAHDNPFNRWTAGEAALFFRAVDDCAERIDMIINQPDVLARLRSAARVQAAAKFNWIDVLGAYERELLRLTAVEAGRTEPVDELARKDAA